jgi:predicted ATPase
MRVYNIDQALAKLSRNINDSELERTGDNMIAFLKRVLENQKLRNQLLKDLRNAVPYIEDISPDRIFSFTTLKFKEIDSKLEFTAQQMSDGTIRQTFPPSVLVIEEPENAIHSYAVRVFTQIAKEVSTSQKLPSQVFLTTHSAAVVDAVLSVESQQDAPTQCFVTKRRKGSGTIEPVSKNVLSGIAKNLGRPSDFLREGSFDDEPAQLEFLYEPKKD